MATTTVFAAPPAAAAEAVTVNGVEIEERAIGREMQYHPAHSPEETCPHDR